MARKRIVFHVPFKLGYALSGGGIRPGKLIQAFKDIGYAVDVISGDKASRMRAMDDIRYRLERGEEYAFCYAESSVLPTMLTEKGNKPFFPFVDFEFFRMLKGRGIKIGLFYRDIYWKFKYFNKEKPWHWRAWRKLFYHLDLHYYKELLDVFFLPSMELAYLLPESLKEIAVALPPAHDMVEEVSRVAPRTPAEIKIFYVGGVSSPVYDISPLMELGRKYAVTVSTRAEEWPQWEAYYGSLADNVTISHLSGDTLKQAYDAHNVSAIVRTNHEYLNFAMPNKMFEALGRNIPLLVTSGTIVGDFVRDHDIGWNVANDFSDLDPERICTEYHEKVANMIRVKPQYHWVQRARTVEGLLAKSV